jgi:hypothetical protein
MFRGEHPGRQFLVHYLCMGKPLTARQILTVCCPNCGAAAREKCEINSGQPRAEPHLTRLLVVLQNQNRLLHKFVHVVAPDYNRI